MVAPGDPAGAVSRALARLAKATTRRTGQAPALPDLRLLGERAAVAGLVRQAPSSCGGAFRAVPARDGHVGLSLARRADLDLVPALVESDLLAEQVAALGPETERPPDWLWRSVADWAATVEVADAVARAELLGLPVAGVPPGDPPLQSDASWADGVRIRRQGGGRSSPAVPLVVDLTALWAGPLCAHLLGLSGCRVVKVESLTRPDGARRGPARFFDLLHGGHAMVALDLTTATGRRQLADLIGRADLVLEGSRPRALRQWGIDAEAVVDAGISWLSITARGRDSDAVGFGDDVAVSAGLYVRDEHGTPTPCGDAIADPLTGVVAAAAAAESMTGPNAQLIEVSMWHVARATLIGATPSAHLVERRADGWWVEHDGGRTRVAAPWARRGASVAGAVGADNTTELR